MTGALLHLEVLCTGPRAEAMADTKLIAGDERDTDDTKQRQTWVLSQSTHRSQETTAAEQDKYRTGRTLLVYPSLTPTSYGRVKQKKKQKETKQDRLW